MARKRSTETPDWMANSITNLFTPDENGEERDQHKRLVGERTFELLPDTVENLQRYVNRELKRDSSDWRFTTVNGALEFFIKRGFAETERQSNQTNTRHCQSDLFEHEKKWSELFKMDPSLKRKPEMLEKQLNEKEAILAKYATA